jgi:hypothetical protein
MMIFMIYLPRGLAGSIKIWVTVAKQKEYARIHLKDTSKGEHYGKDR